MLFHVMAQHHWETCEGQLEAGGNPKAVSKAEKTRWVEGIDKVKVSGTLGYQTEHTLDALIESDDYIAVQQLFSQLVWRGSVQVRPVRDEIAVRTAAEDWGK